MVRTFALSEQILPFQRVFLGNGQGEVLPLISPLLTQVDMLLGTLSLDWPTHDLQGTPRNSRLTSTDLPDQP